MYSVLLHLKKIGQNPTTQNNQVGYGSYSLLSGTGFTPLVSRQMPGKDYEDFINFCRSCILKKCRLNIHCFPLEIMKRFHIFKLF